MMKTTTSCLALLALALPVGELRAEKPLRLPQPTHAASAESLALAEANFTAPGDASAAWHNPSAMTQNEGTSLLAGYALGWYDTRHLMWQNANRGGAFMHIPQLHASTRLDEAWWLGFAATAREIVHVDTKPLRHGHVVWVAKPSLAFKAADDLSLGAALLVGYGYGYDKNQLRAGDPGNQPRAAAHRYNWDFDLDYTEQVDCGGGFSATYDVSKTVKVAASYETPLRENDIKADQRIGLDWRTSEAWRLAWGWSKEGNLFKQNYRALGMGATHYFDPTLRMMMGYELGARFERPIGRNDHKASLGVGKAIGKTDVTFSYAFADPYHTMHSTYHTWNVSVGMKF